MKSERGFGERRKRVESGRPLFRQGSPDREIFLTYPGGPNAITRVLKTGRGRQKRVRARDMMTEAGPSGFEDRTRGP